MMSSNITKAFPQQGADSDLIRSHGLPIPLLREGFFVLLAGVRLLRIQIMQGSAELRIRPAIRP